MILKILSLVLSLAAQVTAEGNRGLTYEDAALVNLFRDTHRGEMRI